MSRPALAFLLLSVLPSLGAKYRTDNFDVTAPTAQLARQVGTAAEQYRKEIARQWLGRELRPWVERCPLEVVVTFGSRSGASTFRFRSGQVHSQYVRIEGPIEELVDSVLPHELTHTLFAHHFGAPLPRWADEGCAVFSEGESARLRHEIALLRGLVKDDEYSLRVLFNMNDYPKDLWTFYPQSYSVARFLIEAKGRRRFLTFIADGMRADWDKAVRWNYSYDNLDHLERAWRKHLKSQAPAPIVTLLARWARNESHRLVRGFGFDETVLPLACEAAWQRFTARGRTTRRAPAAALGH